MDIKVIASMFEDLKKLIVEQSNNLDKQIRARSIDLPTPQLSQPIIHQVDLSGLKAEVAHTNLFIKEAIEAFLAHNKATPSKSQRHLHTIEFKLSKVVVALVSMAIILIGSMAGNIYQCIENNRLSDIDIKYRYIKANNGIDNKTLYDLEDIFEYNPDKKKQRQLRQNVEQFERKVQQMQENAERARLKEEQANQLQKEANKIKGKI